MKKWLGVALFLALVLLVPAGTQSQFDDLFDQASWNADVQQATADLQQQLDEQTRFDNAIAQALAYKPPL